MCAGCFVFCLFFSILHLQFILKLFFGLSTAFILLTESEASYAGVCPNMYRPGEANWGTDNVDEAASSPPTHIVKEHTLNISALKRQR